MNHDTPQLGAQPYGPATVRIRKFLQRLAALSPATEIEVIGRYAEISASRAFRAAENAVGLAIERSGREAAQTALAGPLLQLVRVSEANTTDTTHAQDDDALRPIAEPALSALLALMMSDVLAASEFSQLYEPFAMAIPMDVLQ